MHTSQLAAAATQYPASVVEDPFAATRRYAAGDAVYLCVTALATPLVVRAHSGAEIDGKQDRLRAFVDKVSDLPARAYSHGLEIPNARAMAAANEILAALIAFPIEPDRVVASAEGGVGVIFYKDGRRASIENLNSGDIIASVAGKTDIESPWVVTPSTVYATLSQIRAHLAD